MDTLQFQKRWPDLHSDKVRHAIRCIPADVAIAMTDEMLEKTVRQISQGVDEVVDMVRAEYEKQYSLKEADS